MRIAIYNRTRREIGGVERYLAQLCPILRSAGHQIALIHEIDLPAERRLLDAGESWCISRIGPDATLAAVSAWKPDLIFIHGFSDFDLVAALLERTPAVFFCHDYVGTCISGEKTMKFPVLRPCDRVFGWECLAHYYPHRCGGWSPITMWREYRKQVTRLDLLRRGGCLITASEAMRREYLRHGFTSERVHRLRLGSEAAAIERTPPDGLVWRLLFAERMERVKGGDLLLDALPRAASALDRKLRLTMAGAGRAREAWERRARQIAANCDRVEIQFTGWVDQEELRGILGATDLLVMPSLWPEPFGLAGVEAARAGIPAAACASGGIPEWLCDGVNGTLAAGSPPSSKSLADAIVRCLRDPAQYQRMSVEAARRAAEFGIGDHAGQLIGILQAAVEERLADAGVR